jgi:hypothetical protein
MTTENAIEDSLIRIGLDAGTPTSGAEMRTTSHENATAGYICVSRWRNDSRGVSSLPRDATGPALTGSPCVELTQPASSNTSSGSTKRMGDKPGDAGCVPATRYAVVSADVIRLVLSDECNPLASIALGPADIIGLTSDLLNAARIRCGRPFNP